MGDVGVKDRPSGFGCLHMHKHQGQKKANAKQLKRFFANSIPQFKYFFLLLVFFYKLSEEQLKYLFSHSQYNLKIPTFL